MLLALLLSLAAAFASGQDGVFDPVLNPDEVKYDPETGNYYDSLGEKMEDPPPVPPFLENRGWRRDEDGRLRDPKGNPVDPSEIYPSPEEVLPRNHGYFYDPETGTFRDSRGREGGYPPIPPYLSERGYRQDPRTGEISDPDGEPVDMSTLYPPPPGPSALYDPETGKYYAPSGEQAPPDSSLIDRGWRQDPETGRWIDPDGNEHDPSDLFRAPDIHDNPGDIYYDPQTGKYYDSSGNRIEVELPQYMEDRGYRVDSEGKITDPDGNEVDPATLFEELDGLSDSHTYDPETKIWYDGSGRRTGPPELPDYMEDRGYEMDPTGSEIVGPDGERLAPEDLFDEPAPNPLIRFDPETGKFYVGGNEVPPEVPDYLENRGWQFDYEKGKFRDGDGNLVEPSELYDPPHPGDLPEGTPESTEPPDDLSFDGFDSNGTVFPADGSLALLPLDGSPGWTRWSPSALNVPGAVSAGREDDVQLMILMFLEGTVPGTRQASAGGLVASLGPVVPPQEEGMPVRASVRGLGVSSGSAFTVELSNRGAFPVELAAAGVVVEPLRAEDGRDALREHAESAERMTELAVDGYCLELDKAPPPPGTVFRVAAAEIQERFQPMREILRAAKNVLDDGGLNPDSDPESYFHSIVQWALWTEEKGFDAGGFAEAFVERTRENFEAAGRSFTAEIEATVRALAPNRWRDVGRVMEAAEAL